MDKEDIRIPKYVVKVLAEKLREFVEDNEKSFKFHPWQVTSTLNKIQKSIHSNLSERAIHHLHDTGTAGEIMKFSKENEKSVKLGKVKNYLYSQLGLYSNMPRALENGCQIIYPESHLYDAMRRNRIFEIRRLVDAIIHQLEQTSKQNGKAYHIQLNNLNKFSNPKTPKKQALAHCNYTCCLFYGHEKRKEKKKIFKRSPRSMKINFIKRNIKKTSQTYPHRKSTSQNIVPKIYLSPRSMPTLMRSKTLVDSTTQTTWSLKAPLRESLYEDEPLDISISEESMESGSDFYCKSDTLNDASMITDQIASEFVQDITQSEIKNEKTLSKRKSTKSSAMSKFSNQSKSPMKEITKTNSENNVSNELVMNDNSISSLNSIKLEAIEGTVNFFKSMELKTNENTETKTKSKSVLIRSSKNDASYSKCFELDATQNNVTNSKSIDLEINPVNMADGKSAEMEVMSNNSNSSNLETVKDSKIHSKSHHSRENKNNNSPIHQTEKTENSMTNDKPIKIEPSTNNLKNPEIPPDLKIDSPTHHDSAQPNQENHRVTKKLRKPKKPLLGLISSYARKVALSRCKTSLIGSAEDNSRKVALSRCKTSLLESMEDQPGADQEQKECEIIENSEKIPADVQENEINDEHPNSVKPSNNGVSLEPEKIDAKEEEKDSNDIIKKNSNSKPVRKYFGDSFESILNSENDTTYCPKSSVSVSDQSISEPETDEVSVRSSIKENDNVSLEYSSHWTMEYSSTEASESEDEEFKEKFREYKKHLLEDDEGIAASCEEESSFGMEHHMKEMAVMSAEGKRSLMMIAKQNDGFPTFSYDEDTSYFMDTETFDENLESYEQMSYSIVTQEGTYAESGEDSRTRHDDSGDNKTPSYEDVPYEEKVETVDDNSMKNKDKAEEINVILCNKNTDDVFGTEDIDNEEVSCDMNNAKEDGGTSLKENLRNSDKQISGNDEDNTSKDHVSSDKAKEAETSLDADDISSNVISQERGCSSISVDEVAYKNSQEIETISKILGEFPLRRDNTITENNDILCMEEFPINDATKISKNNVESSEVSERENTEQEDEISDKNGEISDNEFYSENNVGESKEIENMNPEENANNNNVELCEEIQSKKDDESKECISEEVLSKDFREHEREYEDDESKKCLSEEILSKDFTPHERESENEQENGVNEESRDDLESTENHQNEVLDPDRNEEDVEENPNIETEINEDQESQNVTSFNCESTENFNSNEESRKSSISESNEDLTALNIDENLLENAVGDDHKSSLEDQSNASDEITENVVSVIEDIQGVTELDSKVDEDLSEEQSEAHKTVISEHENMLGEDDKENEVQEDQTTIHDSSLCEVDAIEDDDINEEDDEKSNKETATLKVNNQIYKKSHSADEDLKTKRLLKVLSLTDSQPFQDIDLMHEDLLEIVDVDGWNMLHLAASKGLEHFLKKVLQHGLSTEDLTDDNHTALQLAVINNNLKCCQILLKHGASLTTEEGSFDENFMETAGDVSSNIKELLENYKCNYIKVQNLAETINQFSSEKKDLSQPLPKNILEILADITIEDEEDTEENNVELSTD